ncbi:Aldolase-type TIM barrel family protein [Zea mays]|uniref:Aldolase-type TIM barrel family protein n=1 Tax=Zea mays TaxID=4577 RepID=A0A1D6JAV7_MAIZE|nr:Aldolase-type TIM barrel family protein [Zea mays]AQK45024.1 Aldolase-type TIM barrel family protein [Zea mays]
MFLNRECSACYDCPRSSAWIPISPFIDGIRRNSCHQGQRDLPFWRCLDLTLKLLIFLLYW